MNTDISLTAIPGFEKAADAAFGSDLNYWRFQEWLLINPAAGKIIPGTGGARKVRWVDSGRGKGARGGLRIIYFWFESYLTIVLMQVYSKDTREDLTPEEKSDLRRQFAALRQELERRHRP